jgi:hypothetical protein
MSDKNFILPSRISLKSSNGYYVSKFDSPDYYYNIDNKPMTCLGAYKGEIDKECMFDVTYLTNLVFVDDNDNPTEVIGNIQDYVLLTDCNGYFFTDNITGAVEGVLCTESRDQANYFDNSFQVIWFPLNKIVLKNVRSGKFVSRYYVYGRQYLNVSKSSIDDFCYFTVEEPVLKKTISDIKYDLGHSKIEDSVPIIFTQTIKGDEGLEVESQVTYSYKKIKIGTWNNTAGIEVGVKTEFKCGVPCLAEGKIGVDVTVSGSHEWGGSEGVEEEVSSSAKVISKSKKPIKATVTIKRAKITVPFTYTLKKMYLGGEESTEYEQQGVYENVECLTTDIVTSPLD